MGSPRRVWVPSFPGGGTLKACNGDWDRSGIHRDPAACGRVTALPRTMAPYVSCEWVVSSWSVSPTLVEAVTVRVVGKKPPINARTPPASTSHRPMPIS
jgi:hypothetical protein